MRYVTTTAPGGIDMLTLAEGPVPQPGPHDLLVRVHASALNRADTLQREGVYVPPPDQSQVMGVEIAGEVAAHGASVHGFAVGDRVMGLVNGGGYAEYCLLHHALAVPVPDSLSAVDAAALPEACYTAHEAMVDRGGLLPGQTVLIHAGASGIGTMALQMARRIGARTLFTTSTPAKRDACLALGGDIGILYPEEDFTARVLEETDGRGVDLVIDFVGAPYFDRNVAALAVDGTLMLVGVLGGWQGSADLLPLIMKRIAVKGFSMRGQPHAGKVAIVSRFRTRWLPEIGTGHLRPVVHRTFPLDQVAEAHREIEANRNVGKIVLTC